MFMQEQLLFLVVLSHLILPPIAAVIFTSVVVLLLQYLVAPKVVLYARCFFFHSFLNPRPLPALFAGYTAVQGSELSNTNDGSGAMTSPAYSYTCSSGCPAGKYGSGSDCTSCTAGERSEPKCGASETKNKSKKLNQN